MFVCYIIYVAFFIVVIIYAALSGEKMKRSFCSFSIMPNILINGAPIGSVQFIGLKGLSNLYEQFGEQVLGIGTY
jgi:uncharacterized membrane protein